MSVRETLDSVLATLRDDQLDEVPHYAEFISEREERIAWRQFGQSQFARAYGPNEPDYTPADIKQDAQS
jgi:hypothetical protein